MYCFAFIALKASFPGQPRQAGTRKVSYTVLAFNETRNDGMTVPSAGPFMQIIGISLQTDNHASTSPLIFYRPDALLDAQLSMLKH